VGQDPQQLILMCPCGQKMKVPAEAIGKDASCVKCGQKIPITQENAQIATNGKAQPHPTFDLSDDAAIQRLLEEGKITQGNVDLAVLVNTDIDEPIWSVLVRLGYVSREDFHRFLVKREGIASIDLAHYNVPTAALEVLPESLIRKHLVVPIDKLGKLLTVTMGNPLDNHATQAIQAHTGLRVKTMLSTSEDIVRFIRKKYPSNKNFLSPNLPSTSFSVVEKFYYEKLACPFTERLFSIDHLPICAATVEGVQQVLHDTLNPVNELVAVLAKDPSATLHVLRIANTEAYGFAGHVDNLGVAITLLGPEAILAHLKGCRLRNETPTYAANNSFAQICGDACAAISGVANVATPPSMKTLGLLSGLGELVLSECLPTSYEAVIKEFRENGRENDFGSCFDLTAGDASTFITSFWNLPESIIVPMQNNASISASTGHSERTAVLSLGLHIARTHAARKDLGPPTDSEAVECLNIKWANIETIYADLLQNVPVQQIA